MQKRDAANEAKSARTNDFFSFNLRPTAFFTPALLQIIVAVKMTDFFEGRNLKLAPDNSTATPANFKILIPFSILGVFQNA